MDLTVGTLTLLGNAFHDLRAAGQQASGLWQLQVSGPEAEGSVQVPMSSSLPVPVTVRLQRLQLSQEPGEQSGGPLSPADLPAFVVDIQHLVVRDKDYGHLSFNTRREPHVLTLENLKLDNPRFQVGASGEWSAYDGGSRTRLELTGKSTDVGGALDWLGYSGVMIGGKGNVSATLEWPGGPASLDLKRLTGKVHMVAQDGELPQVEPGVGRLFGLLSIATLPRRFSLNFKDLFGKGFAFDRMEGRFQLKDGFADPKVLYMIGPAAIISAKGRVDLVNRQYDETVTVIPQTSSTLPLIGGLLGGPVAGVILFVTQKLFSKDLDKVAQYQYRVTGPWKDPKIEEK